MVKVYFLVLFSFLVINQKGTAQLIVNQSDAQSLIGSYLFPAACYQSSNITYEGNTEALGFFANGTGVLEMDRGVIMSNAKLIHVGWPASHACGLQLNYGAVSRPEPSLGFMVFPNILEFDVVSKGNQLSFDYFFGSEEYCEYLLSTKYTAFGLYVSGPGIIGAPNIAMVPSTTSVINSKNINHNTNSSFYNSNVTTLNTSGPCAGHPNVPNSPYAMAASTGFMFDGFSKVITSSINVVPCQTYHVKAIFTNINGVSEPSAVFLKERDCDFPDAEFVNTTDPTSSQVIEGCHSAELRFYRPSTSNIALPFVINYIVENTSTATAGADYVANFPGQITIPPGQTSIAIPVTIINDGIAETIEQIDVTVLNSASCNGIIQTSLFIKDPTPLLLSADDVVNCSPTATLNVSVTGGSMPYSYLWQNGANSASITVPKSTSGGTSTYFVTVTDACGVSKSIGVNVLETTFTTATISSPKSYICSALDKGIVLVSFTGSAPWKYEYTIDGVAQPVRITSKNPDTIFANSASAFNLLSLNDGNCSALVGSVQIIDNPDLGATMTPTRLRCFGTNDGMLSVNLPTSAKAPITYNWSTGSLNVSSINNLSPGYYNVTVTDSKGCYSILGDNINQPDLLEATTFVNSDETCVKKGSASAFAAGGTSPYSFSWSSGAMTAVPNNLSAGLNRVTITDKNGCTDTTSVMIGADKMIVDAELKFNSLIVNCRTPFVNLYAEGGAIGPAGYTFQWGSPAVNPSLGTGWSTNVTQAGSYTLTITDKNNGCTLSKAIDISSNQAKPVAKVKLPDFLICDFVPVLKLDVSGTSTGPNYTYLWSGPFGFNSKELTPSIFIPGTYSLVVTDTTNGCTNSAQVMMSNTNTPTIANTGPDQTLNCLTRNITVGQYSSAGPNFQYQWSNGNTQREQVLDKPGVYYLTVTNTANNCVKYDTIVVNEDILLPTAVASSSGYLNCYNNSLIINGSGSGGTALDFKWSNSASGTSTVVSQPGIYTLSITNMENGCVATDTVQVRGDKSIPAIDILKSNEIDCLHSDAILDGTVNLSANFKAQWTSFEGYQTLSGMRIKTSNPGAYTLKITNNINGCSNELTAIVSNNTQLPEIDFPLEKTLNCAFPNIGLGNDKNIAGYNYSWSTQNGKIVGGQDTRNAVADKAGTYQLIITNTTTGCTKIATVTVGENFDTPKAVVDLPESITCSKALINIDAGASAGSNLQYEWSTTNGTIVGSRFSPLISVSKGGLFTLKLTDAKSLCSVNYQVSVEDIRLFPIAKITNPPLITCKNLEIALDGQASSLGSSYIYNWSAKSGGNIVSGQNTLNPIVNKTGTYSLKVTNLSNNCSAESSISVQQDKVSPTANAGPNKTLTCAVSNVALSGSGSTGPNFSYLWTTTNGAVLSGATSLIASVNQAGTYTLVVTNKTNGCTASSQMLVKKDPLVPNANAGQNAMLNCSNSTVQLDARASSSGPNYTFLWATSNGNFVSGQKTLQPVVDKAGVYRLIVTDNSSNCKAFANVQVTLDRTVPVIKIAKPDLLNCAKPTITLNTFGSSSGASIKHYWKTVDGKIEGKDSIPQPEISKSGNYQLRIYNTINTCYRDTSVFVAENKNKPAALISSPDSLNCGANEIKLDASNSQNIASSRISWKTVDGKITANPRSLNPTVNQAGTYTMVVVDTLSFCIDSASVIVKKSTSSLLANVTSPILNCNRPTDRIISQVSATGPVDYWWSTNNGEIINGDSTANPEISKAGQYNLVIKDKDGCTATYTTTVSTDFEKPAFEIAVPDTINCLRDTISINAKLLQNATDLSYEWKGNFISSLGTKAIVNQQGTFTLNIKNNANGCSFVDSVKVIENKILPDVTLLGVDTLTCAKKQILLSAQIQNAGKYIAIWSTLNGNILSGNTFDTIAVNQKGDYKLLVTNPVNGCSSIQNAAVYENKELPQFTIQGLTKLNCRDTTGTLSIIANGKKYNYLWENGSIDIMRDINKAGMYSVTAVDVSNACETKQIIEVLEDKNKPFLVVPNPKVLTCDRKQVELSITNPAADWQINWTIPSGSFIKDSTKIHVDSSGIYRVVVTNPTNFCSTEESIEVLSNTLKPNANAGPDKILDCKSSSIPLEGSVSGSGNIVVWSGPSILGPNFTLNPQIQKPGLYILKVTRTDNGCVALDSVNVVTPGLPIIQMAKPQVLTCIQKNVVLDASGSTNGAGIEQSWTNQSGLLIGNNSTTTVDIAGKYYFTVKDKNSGCIKDTVIEVIENVLKPVANAGTTQTISCQTKIAILDANTSSKGPDYVYEWFGRIISAGATTLSPSVGEAGIYRLKVTDLRNGCTDTSSVLVHSLLPEAEIIVKQPACFGETGKIEFSAVRNGTAPYLFSIDAAGSFSINQIYNALPKGIYNTIVKDANGCEFKKEISIIEAKPFSIEIEAGNLLKPGESFQPTVRILPYSSAVAKIRWVPSTFLSCSDCISPTIVNAVHPVTYNISAWNSDGCEANAIFLLKVKKSIEVYAPNIFSPNNDNNNDRFTLFGNANVVLKINSLQIYNRWGDLLFNGIDLRPNEVQDGWDGKFRGEMQNQGVYIWRAEITLYDGKTEQLSGEVVIN
ncbi:MAG: choice-of-anchor L domain-containing protein [Saprospiraceae bacterium]